MFVGRGPDKEEANVFNAGAWDAATAKVEEAYNNEGYIYVSIRPIIERRKVGKDSVPTVDLRWEIDERTPAIVNRVDIVGNDVTTETCIRDQLFQAFVFMFGASNSFIEIVHIGLVMLAVVYLHGLTVDVWFQCIKCIWQRR